MLRPTVTIKGQTTIPKDIGNQLNPGPGNRLGPVIDEDSRALLSHASIAASELEGMLTPPARRVIVEDMNRTIRKRGGRP